MISTIIVTILVCVISSTHYKEIKVTVKLGSIHGFKEKINENEVNIFLGIPFALPPIGDLRFRKPQPITKKWTAPLDATKWPKICMQDTYLSPYFNEASEDCLYLNIWTPVNLDEDFSSSLRPVMVFIHGGGFTFMGISHKHHNASVLSSFGDVVVVTLNYRLAAFGFLSAGNSDAPGNVGLYDQSLALEWVQQNIAYFGGDPKRVTLFGESAGAWSISLHLLSPVSHHKFNRAILMSGASFRGIFLDTKDEAVRKALELSKLVGCAVEGEKHMKDSHMECLRQVDAEKIVQHQLVPQISLVSKSLAKIWFVPLVGETFVPKKPNEMLQQRYFNEGVDVLVGTVANEGYIMHFFLQMIGVSIKGDNWQKRLRSFVTISFSDLSDYQIDEVVTFYFNGIHNKSSDEAKMAYYTALGDVYFNCETSRFSEILSKSNDVYQYLFDYRFVNEKDHFANCDLDKACHANEIPLTFGTVSNPEDIAVMKTWMKILSGFARSGTVEWPKHGRESTPYYEFNGRESSNRVLYNYRSDSCKLWKPIFDRHYRSSEV